MTIVASMADEPRFPGFPPEVPYPPPSPGPPLPGHPPVPTVPVPGPAAPAEDLRALVYEQLLARRTVILDRALDAPTATLLAAQLMSLDAEGTDPITLVVNSPGGSLDAASAVLDTLDLVRGPVATTCLGQAVGTAAVVVAAGTGHRRIGAGAQMRLRLAEVAIEGSARRIDDDLAHLAELRGVLVDRLAAVTGQDRRLVERDIDEGRILSAPEAVAYGLVDEVIRPRAR